MMDKILVADDDLNICELLRLYLEKEGFEVVMAHDGEEAVAKFESEKPSLILLDIMMPKLDGWQVCRQIRQKSDCPIIMLTAKGETFDKVLGLELGADDYVVKPFDTKEIVARIKAVLRRSSPAGTAEGEVKEVSYDKLTVNMTRYELKVDGKVVDAKYYTVSGSNVTFTAEFLKTLKNGSHTVTVENATKIAKGVFTVNNPTTAQSPTTADAGIALYAGMAIASVMGTGVVFASRKRKNH